MKIGVRNIKCKKCWMQQLWWVKWDYCWAWTELGKKSLEKI